MGLLSKIFGGAKKAAGILNPAGGALRGALSGRSAGDIGRDFTGNSMDAMKGAAVLAPVALSGGAAAGAMGGLAGGAGAAGGAAGGAGGLMGSLGGLGGIAKLGLGAFGAYQGAKDMSRGNAMQDQAREMMMSEWNADAPLREKQRALAMMDIPEREDMSSMYEGSGNPFARPAARPPMPGMPTPPMAGPAPADSRLRRAFRGGGR